MVMTLSDRPAAMKTILYARVSTTDQTIVHQRQQAEAAGFKIDAVIGDDGVSGIHVPLAERPQGKRLFDLLRAGDILVVRWVDRLGRNYADVSDAIREFIRRGVVIKTVINNMTFDGSTKDPMQQAVRDALIGFMAAMAQSQAEVTKEAQRDGRYRGRKPSYSREQYKAVCDLLSQNANISVIAKETRLTRQAVYRIKQFPCEAEATLAAWGL
jgi:putative DNA-invertase from lambdoid prophage Rac